jgi:hypothetical protein
MTRVLPLILVSRFKLRASVGTVFFKRNQVHGLSVYPCFKHANVFFHVREGDLLETQNLCQRAILIRLD